MRQRYFELLLFSTYAELRAERSRSYLGLVWWVLEPAMMMAVFYLVFAIVLKSSAPDYVPFLLVGLTIWQWFKSCVSHGGHAIWTNLALIRQVKLPTLIFPSVQILADSVKFLYILTLLLIILWVTGYPPNAAYLALLPVLLVEFVFAVGVSYLVAAIVPLVPDFRFVIEQFLQIVMFLSGVVFALESVPEPWRALFKLNPIAVLVDAARGILMYARWPDWGSLLQVALISLAMCVLGGLSVTRLTPRYVKLAT